jgi:hypothetical protein
MFIKMYQYTQPHHFEVVYLLVLLPAQQTTPFQELCSHNIEAHPLSKTAVDNL